jgi:hypothetical protein
LRLRQIPFLEDAVNVQRLVLNRLRGPDLIGNRHLAIAILRPTANQVVQPGQLSVTGSASGSAVTTPSGVEGLVIEWVQVTVDGGTPVSAVLTAGQGSALTGNAATPSYSFVAVVTIPGTSGPHVISAVSTSDIGAQQSAQVTVTVGQPSVKATLIGTATLTSDDPSLPGSYSTAPGAVVLGLEFSGDGSSVQVTSFQAMTIGPFGPVGTITITLNAGNPPGAVNAPSEGSLNLTASFHLVPSITLFGGASDITFKLTTDAGDGSPLNQANRMIALVDDPRQPPSTLVGGFGEAVHGAVHLRIIGNASPLPS